MATEYTPNYNLDLYAGTDKPNLRDQYNAAMGKIDTQMKANADAVTNANANVAAMQTQVTKNKDDIAALESTVEAHGTQITDVQTTADDALSLAQTNEGDIASTESDVTTLKSQMETANGNIGTLQSQMGDINSDIDTLQSQMGTANSNISRIDGEVDGKAPTDHSSTQTTYGVGNGSDYGHLRLSDNSGSSNVNSGTAATPLAVQNAVRDLNTAIGTPKLFKFGTASSGNLYGSLCVNESIKLCTLRVSFFNFVPTVINNYSSPIYTVPAQYRPTNAFSIIADVNYQAPSSVRAVTSVRMNEGGDVRYIQYAQTATGVAQDCVLTWFYGAQVQ